MRWIRDNEVDPRYPFWTRANLNEVFPEPPSPLGWDLAWEGACLAGWRDAYVHRFGMEEHELSRDRVEAIAVFGGYPYLGASMFRVWAGRTPGMSPTAIDDAYFGDHPDVPPYVAEAWHTNPRTSEVMGGWLQWATGDMDQAEMAADHVESLRIRAERPDLTVCSDAGLLGRALGMRPLLRSMSRQSTVQNVAASIGPGILGQVCAGIGEPEVVTRLLAGLGDIDSAAPSFALWELSRAVRASPPLTELFEGGTDGLTDALARRDEPEVVAFTAAFRSFLDEFGARGTNEWELAAPVWEVCPDAALAAVDRMRAAEDDASPLARNAEREADREELAARIGSMLAGNPEAAGAFDLGLRAAGTFIAGRERAKGSVVRVLHEARIAVAELGRRFAARGVLDDPDDVFLLFVDELAELVADALPDVRDLVQERREHRAWLTALEPPFIIVGEPPPNTTWPTRQDGRGASLAVGDVLVGTPGSPGTATGRARVILSSLDPSALEPGDVLVAPGTDPSWTPLFVPAAAVVVDVGAMLSHAVIVSRELGIPCVASAVGASKCIPDGALVTVDGTAGTVTVIELPD